ncbi:hypothetical protein B0H11DRAFT_1928545 [Mycena galericulata]|nr:hypothetical protein B0H11DRAFT_1928545 [Mycena galericulata]
MRIARTRNGVVGLDSAVKEIGEHEETKQIICESTLYAAIPHDSIPQLRKFFCGEQFEGLSENSAVADIRFEVGSIQGAEETAGFVERDYGGHSGSVWFPLSPTLHRLATMSRTKTAKSKNAKPKEMFKAYIVAEVPDIMPFPELALVATTKGGEAAVPKLNEYQQSWIHDIGLRDIDLANLERKAAIDFYDEVKTKAFDAKAFQHTVQPGDLVEEAHLPKLVTAWKLKQSKKNDNTAADDGDASEEEEDEAGRAGLLRGYPKAGWRIAIQKVISNKRADAKRKLKTNKNDGAEEESTPAAAASAAALAKVIGLNVYTSRDKFRDDRHDNIHEYSKTLPGAMNAGGKFRKAEALLWAKEDQASWAAAAAADQDVDWVERQKLVATGFKNMVNSLNASRKVEAVPEGIHVRQSFETQYGKLVEECLNGMYVWADKPLKDYVATLEHSAKDAPPVFPLGADAVEEMCPKDLAQTVTSFLADSYQAAFGSREIPWAAIASAPDEYYDAEKFPLGFASNGLAELKRNQFYDLGTALASCAGAGTSGLFRKTPSSVPPPPPPSPPRSPSPPPAEGREAEEREAEERKWEAALLRHEVEEREAEEHEREAERLRREAEKREVEEREREAARKAEECEAEEHEREAECLRREAEEREEEEDEEEVPSAPKKAGRKRKANIQLVPEHAGAVGRPSRTRKTPKEAQQARAAMLAATVRGAGRPRYEYVEKSPVKGPAAKGARGSTTSQIGTDQFEAPMTFPMVDTVRDVTEIEILPYSSTPNPHNPPNAPKFTDLKFADLKSGGLELGPSTTIWDARVLTTHLLATALQLGSNSEDRIDLNNWYSGRIPASYAPTSAHESVAPQRHSASSSEQDTAAPDPGPWPPALNAQVWCTYHVGFEPRYPGLISLPPPLTFPTPVPPSHPRSGHSSNQSDSSSTFALDDERLKRNEQGGE